MLVVAHTTDLVVRASEASCRVSMRRTKRRMKRFSSKRRDANMAKRSLGKYKNIGAEPQRMQRRVSRNSPLRITLVEEARIGVRPRLCCMTDEPVSGIVDAAAVVQRLVVAVLGSIWTSITPLCWAGGGRRLLLVRLDR